MKEARTNLATAVCGGKVYVFSKAGATDKLDVYDLDADTWESAVCREPVRFLVQFVWITVYLC